MINNIQDWKEISRGYYRYVVAAKVAYEILITEWYSPEDSNILNAYGKGYIAGIWSDGSEWVFQREYLGMGTVEELLKIIKKDYKEMEEV